MLNFNTTFSQVKANSLKGDNKWINSNLCLAGVCTIDAKRMKDKVACTFQNV